MREEDRPGGMNREHGIEMMRIANAVRLRHETELARRRRRSCTGDRPCLEPWMVGRDGRGSRIRPTAVGAQYKSVRASDRDSGSAAISITG